MGPIRRAAADEDERKGQPIRQPLPGAEAERHGETFVGGPQQAAAASRAQSSTMTRVDDLPKIHETAMPAAKFVLSAHQRAVGEVPPLRLSKRAKPPTQNFGKAPRDADQELVPV